LKSQSIIYLFLPTLQLPNLGLVIRNKKEHFIFSQNTLMKKLCLVGKKSHKSCRHDEQFNGIIIEGSRYDHCFPGADRARCGRNSSLRKPIKCDFSCVLLSSTYLAAATDLVSRRRSTCSRSVQSLAPRQTVCIAHCLLPTQT
jgi:hypothetical protein